MKGHKMNHKILLKVDDRTVETLEDILPKKPGLDLLFIAKTPAKISVENGHYFQGNQGKMFWNKLSEYDLLNVNLGEFEDDHLIENGYGLTDIVKVPRNYGNEPSDVEYKSGSDRILSFIELHKPKVIVFVYKKVLDNILKYKFNTKIKTVYGFNSKLYSLFGCRVFVFPMPGTPCIADEAAKAMSELKLMLGIVRKDKRIYIYKLSTDNGGAPCIYKDLLSLAICKPKIRSTAGLGDWIIGIGGKSTIGERLIYVAKVNTKLHDGCYYKEEYYFNRPDCIYRWEETTQKYYWMKGKPFHKNGDFLDHDLGKDGDTFKSTEVILSEEFRYYGKEGNEDYKQNFPRLRDLIENLTRGHRVNHLEELRKEAEDLIYACMSKEKKNVKPSEDPHSGSCCNDDDECLHTI